MKKCVLKDAEPLVNELGQAMFSGSGNRKYQSTGAITTSVSVQMRNKAGKFLTKVNRPKNIPKGAIGSVFTEESAEFKVETFKSILSVEDLSSIQLMRDVSRLIVDHCKSAYDRTPNVQFEYNGSKLNTVKLSAFKQQVREKNNDRRNQIEGQVRAKLGSSDASLIKKVVNRAYTPNKMLISPISVVINVQISHNIYSGNYAVKNVNLDDLNLDNYRNTNGTYSAEREKGITFTIPCHSVEHASQLCEGMARVLDKIYENLSQSGFERLVDTNHRTEEQIANDEAIVNGSKNEAGVPTRSFDALDAVVDETTTSTEEVLRDLGVIKHTGQRLGNVSIFSNPNE